MAPIDLVPKIGEPRFQEASSGLWFHLISCLIRYRLSDFGKIVAKKRDFSQISALSVGSRLP
jgi:hypothetical protein